MNLKELNYILIPRPGESMERWEASSLAKLLRPLVWLWRALTPEGIALVLATLACGLAGMDIRFSHIYMVFCGLLGLLAAAFIARALASIRGLRLEIEHPPRVRSGEPVEFTLVLRNKGPRSIYALRVAGPFLPWDGSWESRPPTVPFIEPGQEVRVRMAARFLCRGRRLLGHFSVGSVRPLGLVMGPRLRSPRVVLTVLPRVCAVDRLPLPSRASYQPGGLIQSASAGESFELLGLRDYRPGDRLRDLHPRSWARLGRPVVREYRQEFYRRAAVMLHTQISTRKLEVFDAATELCAGLVSRLVHDEALVDLLLLGERSTVTTLGCHVSVLEEGLDLLAAAEPTRQPVTAMGLPLLGPYMDRLSAVYLVMLDWDQERAALVDELRGHGLSVLPCLVRASHRGGGVVEARSAGVRVLSPAELRRSEPLVLEL